MSPSKMLSKFIRVIKLVIKPIIFFFVKYECVICEEEVRIKSPVCFNCNRKIGAINQSSVCEKCGRYCLAQHCIFCLQNPPYFKQGKAFCVYDATSSRVIKQFKYYGNSLCREFMAKKMTQILQRDFLKNGVEIDLITCVPMSWFKEYLNGKNHAGQLSSKIAKNVGIKYNPNLLKRKFKFKRQVLLNQKDRIENVRGVFTTKNCSEIVGKSILIIDDTITTGATLNECTKALLQSSANNIFVLTFGKSIADETIYKV